MIRTSASSQSWSSAQCGLVPDAAGGELVVVGACSGLAEIAARGHRDGVAATNAPRGSRLRELTNQQPPARDHARSGQLAPLKARQDLRLPDERGKRIADRAYAVDDGTQRPAVGS